MSKVRLTYRPTRDPTSGQPSSLEMETVAEALIALHKLNKSKPYQSGIEISEEGKALYHEDGLAKAMGRINNLIEQNTPLDNAAEQIANEDGYS